MSQETLGLCVMDSKLYFIRSRPGPLILDVNSEIHTWMVSSSDGSTGSQQSLCDRSEMTVA